MNQVLEFVGRVGLLFLILLAVTFLPWPDITIYLSFIRTFVEYLWSFNPYMPIDTLFVAFQVVLVIDGSILLFRFVTGISAWIAGSDFIHHKKTE